MSSSKAKNIEDAFFYAGIRVIGDSVYTKCGGKTYLTSIYYTAEAASPELRESLRERILKIANSAGCFLFLECQDGRCEEGRATFVLKKELMEWAKMLDFEMEKLTQEFEFFQEEPSAVAAAEVLREGIISLVESIEKSKDMRKFSSNDSRLREHLKLIDTLRQDYLKGIDFTDNRMYKVLVNWNQSYLPAPSPNLGKAETVTITGVGDLTSALNSFI